MSNILNHEAEAFDRHARERVEHGQVPDLRRLQPCDFFYNNIWRRPYLVDMECGRNLRFALAHLSPGRVLEVGSGPGHMALELARSGFMVTGLELSGEAVKIARQFAQENPFVEGFGDLEYVQDDFLAWEPATAFDGVCFFNTLHHFDNLEAILQKVARLLVPGGRLIVVEPARDWLTEREAAVAVLVQQLLAARGEWFQGLHLPADQTEIAGAVEACLREYQEAKDREDRGQSPNDNSSFAKEMLSSLRSRFQEVECQPGASVFYKLGGGIRGSSEDEVRRLAEFLHHFDSYAVRAGILNAGEFLWAGRTRE